MGRITTTRTTVGVAALLLALTACGDDATSTASSGAASASASASAEESGARAELRAALTATSEETSASVRLTVDTALAGQTVSTSGEGVIGFGDPAQARFTLTLPGEAGGGEIEVRTVDGIVYVQLPANAAPGLPPDAAGKFLRVDPEAQGSGSPGGLPGLGQLGGSAGGLSDSLRQLRDAESVEAAGEGEVGGEPVTLYRVTVDPAEATGSAPPGLPDTISYTVAIGEDDLLREVRSSVPLDLGGMAPSTAPAAATSPSAAPSGSAAPDPSASDLSGSVDVVFTFVEYGVELSVEAPPEDQVIDPAQVAA